MRITYTVEFSNGKIRYIYDPINIEEEIKREYPNWKPTKISKIEYGHTNYDKGSWVKGPEDLQS